jgi:ribosome modulation factor
MDPSPLWRAFSCLKLRPAGLTQACTTPTEDASMVKESAMQYPLQAWIEGHYARDCGEPREKCPYAHGSAMALAWYGGWSNRDQLDAAKDPAAETGD